MVLSPYKWKEIMRQYEPAHASSYTKLGPDNRYKFAKGTPTGALTREDEMWMDLLVVSGMLVCVKDTNPKPVREVPEVPTKTIETPVLTKADILPQTKPPIAREKGYQTHEEFAAKIEVAKAVEKMEETDESQERVLFDNQEVQDFYDFLKTLLGESVDEMAMSVKAEYFKPALVSLCGILELDKEGTEFELARRLIDWISLENYRNEEIIVTPEVEVEPEPEAEAESIDPDVQKFCEFYETLKELPEDEVMTAVKDEYTKKPLVALAETLELDFDPTDKKAIIVGHIIDWYNSKGN